MSLDLILIDIDWLQVAINDSETENSWHKAYSNQKLIDWMTFVSSFFDTLAYQHMTRYKSDFQMTWRDKKASANSEQKGQKGQRLYQIFINQTRLQQQNWQLNWTKILGSGPRRTQAQPITDHIVFKVRRILFSAVLADKYSCQWSYSRNICIQAHKFWFYLV